MTTTSPTDGALALARFRDGVPCRSDSSRATASAARPEHSGRRPERLPGDADWRRLGRARTTGLALADVDVLTAPVEPRQVLQAGANYRQHVIELVAAGLTEQPDRTPDEAREFAADDDGRPRRQGEPYFFIGLPDGVVGDDVPLTLPAYSEVHDWELELAVVIGRRRSGSPARTPSTTSPATRSSTTSPPATSCSART